MFGSSVLDVLVGVLALFLGVSLATSAITEAIASALKLRQTTLLAGVKALLNDPQFDGLARALYGHALVNPLSAPARITTRPAYIEPRQFARALTDVLASRAPGRPLPEVVAAIADPQLRQTLSALLAAAGADAAAFETAVAAWFDSAMDRLSGWYKRYTQLIGAVAALAVAGLINADAGHVANLLWSHPQLAAVLDARLEGSGADLPGVIAALDAQALIGWSNWAGDPRNTPGGMVLMAGGWLVVAGASLFGAPFWFDLLGKVIWIRGTGLAPAGSPAATRR